MRHFSNSKILAFVLFCSAILFSGCGSSGPTDPRETVIVFFGAMEKNDQAALAHLLDLATLMKSTQADYALNTDIPRQFTSPVEILEDLTNNGLTKLRWFSMQRIVNRSEINGDMATVEVTFADKNSDKNYLTKFGLHMIEGKWKIYSFKVD